MIVKGVAFGVFLIFFVANPAIGQRIISGQVKEIASGEPIAGAGVVIWNTLHQKIMTAGYAGNAGDFQIILSDSVHLELRISAMGYERFIRPIESIAAENLIRMDVYLEKASVRLKEVLIHVQKPIHIHGDTISFDAAQFAKRNEQFVHELLKNIPGVRVEDNGTIKYGDKEIEKLMIEGTDFFEKGYQLLSLNMPAFPIDKIQIINRFSSNKVLRGIQESNKIAMNLTLKEEYRSVWFGNSLFGYGPQPKNRMDLRFDLMSFGKKHKHYLINQYNNIGNRSFDQIAHFLKTDYGEDFPGNDIQINRLLTSGIRRVEGIKQSRINFNSEFLGSYNTIFSLGKQWNLKLISYLNGDQQKYSQESLDRVFLPDHINKNQEQLDQFLNRSEGLIRIDIQGDPSKQVVVSSKTDILLGGSNGSNNYSFNSVPLMEHIREENARIGQKMNYSHRISPTLAVLLNLNLFWANSPQYFSVNDSMIKKMSYSQAFFGGEGRLIKRKGRDHSLEMAIGHTIQEDQVEIDSLYSHYISRTYLQNKYSWKPVSGFSLSAWTRVVLNAVSAQSYKVYKEAFQNTIIFDPGFSLSWEMGKYQKINTSYSLTSSNPELQDRIPVFVSTGYRSAIKGLDNTAISRSSTLTLSHQLGDWISGVSFYSFAYLIWHHQHISFRSTIYPEFTYSEKIWVKAPFQFNVQTTMDYFLESISSNLKVNLGWSKAKPKNQLDGYSLPDKMFDTYKAAIDLRSGFNGSINFHLGAIYSATEVSSRNRSEWSTHSIEGFSDVFVRVGERLEIKALYEWYYLNQLTETSTVFRALDCGLKYKPRSGRLQFELVGENLFNTRFFTFQQHNGYGDSTTSYRLFPRKVLLKIFCRF